jgi:hypothetical protein
MKLNEYLYEKIYAESRKMFQDEECEPLSADGIEKWIVEWYKETFKQVDSEGEKEDSSRLPPMWLANWRKYIELD